LGDVETVRSICRAFASLTTDADAMGTTNNAALQRVWNRFRTDDAENAVYSVEQLVDMEEQYCGFTPLMLAAREGHLEVVKFLVEMNANLEAVSFDGKVRPTG
jgi:hypothetical protein